MIPTYTLSIDPQYQEDTELAIFQIANTENPAIQIKGVAFSDQTKNVFFKDDIKHRIASPVLTPGNIYRKDELTGEEYYAKVTTEFIESVFVDFMEKQAGKQVFNEEHDESKTVPAYILETWLVTNPETDKSKTQYGIDVPEGTWFAVQQFTDKDVYHDYVNRGLTGFSIHGHSAMLEMSEIKFEETYNDYPESAKNNAQKVLDWRDEYGDEVEGMTRVGWTRANQLAKGENISRDTIARMASFKRHEKNAEVSEENKSTPWKDAGRVAWLGWGGTSGVNWAIEKLKSINNSKMIDEKKEVEMEADGKPHAHIELPIGVHTIGDSVYTVEEVIENEGTENEYKCNKIVSIVPIDESASEEVVEATEEKEEVDVEMTEEKEEEVVVEAKAKTEYADEEKEEEVKVEMADEAEMEAYYSKEEIDAKFKELYDMIADVKAEASEDVEVADESNTQLSSNESKGRIDLMGEKLAKFAKFSASKK